MAYAADQAQANNLFGIDVSNNNGSVNWTTVYGNGPRFGFAKATEGNYYEDADFKANMNNGKAAGLQMGAYHFARPDIDCVSTDANYFWNFAGGYIIADGKSLDPMVDFEVLRLGLPGRLHGLVQHLGSDVKAKTSSSCTRSFTAVLLSPVTDRVR